jgi:hypothetical protein
MVNVPLQGDSRLAGGPGAGHGGQMPRWLQRLLRYEPGISLAQWIYDKIAGNWPALVAMVAGGGGMAYLAAITEWLNAWGPIAWGMTFSFGALVIALLIAIFVWASDKIAQKKLRSALIMQSRRVNPLSRNFDHEVIDIVDFFMPLPPYFSVMAKRLRTALYAVRPLLSSPE